MLKQKRVPVVVFSLAVGFINLTVPSGCSRSTDDSRQPITNVTGKVTNKGIAVPAGQVNFVSDVGYGFSATAPLNDDGSFTLRSSRGDGVPPGEYQVSVTLPRKEEGESEPKPSDYPLIPLKSQKFQTSGLRLIVEKEGNHFEIDLAR